MLTAPGRYSDSRNPWIVCLRVSVTAERRFWKTEDGHWQSLLVCTAFAEIKSGWKTIWESKTDVPAKVLVVTRTQVDIGNKATSVLQHIMKELSLETRKPLPCNLGCSRGMQPQGALGWASGETLDFAWEKRQRAKQDSVNSGTPQQWSNSPC